LNVRLGTVLYFLTPLIAITLGCNHPEERFGRTWYLDGAGNWGFGVSETVYGLHKAGYKGQVSAFLWSMTMSPVADQVLKPLAGLGAARLAGNIDDYLNRYPNNDVNLIGLSAGAGVVLKAVEHIKPPHKINNVILLAASISSLYDVRPALKNMRGKIYVYYSSGDAMLAGPVRVLGTFGAKGGEDPAGLIGLRSPGAEGRVVNIGWQPRFEKYGWYGSHTSCTSEAFVQHILSQHIISELAGGTRVAQAGEERLAPEQLSAAPPRTGPAGRPPKPAPQQGPRSPAPEPSRPPALAASAQPSAPVYAPPMGSELASAVTSPVVTPGHPTTFITLSRRDPRFPGRSYLADGMTVRLISVPGTDDAQIEVRAGKADSPMVCRMNAQTGQRCRDAAGRSHVITLLRVDRPSQTAWLQIRQAGEPPQRSAGARTKTTPAT
jgi:hypothetical protein